MVLDAWESAKLKEFDQRVANGEKAGNIGFILKFCLN
jgi:hypothetical protein